MYTLSYIITSQNVWKKIRIWKKNSPMENKFEHGTTFDLKKIDFENKFQFRFRKNTKKRLSKKVSF